MSAPAVSRLLAERIAGLESADLPAEARHAARIALADALAVMLAATGLEPAAVAFADVALDLGGAAGSTVIGRARRAPAPLAALANGALAHAVDFEDTFDAGSVHPNAAVVPAVLALAEAEAASGDEVILALAIGCDLSCRLGLALEADPARRGWYHPPMLTALGAGAAAARLVGLGPDATVDALSLTAVQFALGDELKRSPRSHLRAVRDGFAARAAVEAALLARAGVVGVETPVEGLLTRLAGPAWRADAILDGLGRHFHGPEVGVKRWPCCRGTHAAIAAALALRAEGVAPAAVAAIGVTVAPPDDMLFEPRAQKIRPRTAIDAKFSIPFAMATALVHGAVDLASFAAGRLEDPAVLDLAGRIVLDGIGPAEGARATVDCRLADGTRRRLAVAADPAPAAGGLAMADLADKLAACTAAAAFPVDPAALAAAVEAIETAGPAPLLALLAPRP